MFGHGHPTVCPTGLKPAASIKNQEFSKKKVHLSGLLQNLVRNYVDQFGKIQQRVKHCQKMV